MRCPECGASLMTFWRFVTSADPRKSLSPVCPGCGVALAPGRRTKQLLGLLLVGGGLIGVAVAVAEAAGAAPLPRLLLWAGLAVLALSLAAEALLWRYADHVVRRPGPHPLLKPTVILVVVLIAVLALASALGIVAGVIEASREAAKPLPSRRVEPPPRTPQPVYRPDDAAGFVHQHLPEELRRELSRTDVALILDLEFEYMRQQGLVVDPGEPIEEPEEPVRLDEATMIGFIREEAGEYGRDYTFEAVQTVLEGELDYMRHIGLDVVELDSQSDEDEPASGADEAPSSPE